MRISVEKVRLRLRKASASAISEKGETGEALVEDAGGGRRIRTSLERLGKRMGD